MSDICGQRRRRTRLLTQPTSFPSRRSVLCGRPGSKHGVVDNPNHRSLPREAKVGFVPTMGAFHEGHLDLFRRARSDCDVVVGSVFVNPLQFGPQEDFGRYPRKLESDVGKLAANELADLVFAPSLDAMYLPSHRLYVDPVGFDDLPEGSARPGFFRGVATVVIKLFNVVQPDFAYFGQKDALQCVLIRRLIEDLNVPVQLVVCDTKREPDGLAMSSRNAYMSPAERSAAPVVFRALRAAAEVRERAVAAARCSTREELIREAEAVLSSEPLVTSIEYLSVGSLSTMEEMEKVGNAGAIMSVALHLGSVRLIDNIVLPRS